MREHPDRFSASINVDPNDGMEAVRKIERFADEFDLKCVGAFPAGLNPQVAVDDKKWFPIYAKCVELDIPFASTMGVPGPRIPFSPAGRRPSRRDLLVLPRADASSPATAASRGPSSR